jgi:glycerol-3-phosphate O-acyltransferase/dihydroxyacetone phosphate acyltransferase
MDDFAGEFMSGEEGAPKSAVKRLTKRIEDDMRRLTINSPEWCVCRSSRSTKVVSPPDLTASRIRRDSLNAANMAVQLLWADEKELRMEHYREVVQT